MASPKSGSAPCNDVTTPRRPRHAQRRQRLTERAAELIVTRETSEITLRDLAAALDMSPRMLVHHFGSRDGLITAALGHARSQLLDAARTQLAEQDPHDLRSLVMALRTIVTDPRNRPSFRLFDQINALAQTQPERFPGFGRASVHDWLPQFADLLAPTSTDETDAQAQATVALAVVRGLMLDRNATEEQARIDAAFAVFNDL